VSSSANYAVFVDLTKAFDSVDRTALWEILPKIGCPADFVTIICSFHEGMQVDFKCRLLATEETSTQSSARYGGANPW